MAGRSPEYARRAARTTGMDPFELPPASAHPTSALLCRPLRMKGETGDAPPWTTTVFPDDSDMTPDTGPAYDVVRQLAVDGGSWLAHVSRRFDGRRWTDGEYMVHAGVVTPLVEWQFAWPIEWWERETLHPGQLILAPRLGDATRMLATTAMLNAATPEICVANALDDTYMRAITSLGDDLRQKASDEAGRGVPAKATAHVVGACTGMVKMTDSIVRRAVDEGRITDAQREAWQAEAIAAVRRVVGDAWFVARAEPNAPRM